MQETEQVDVLIVGAGLSGIGAAAQLTREHPGRSYLVLERREVSGGTWDLFRYPGVRSDSDMFTLGYRFKPWTDERALADAGSILGYVRETAAEYGVEEHVRYSHEVVRADFDSSVGRWTVTVRTPEGERRIGCGFLWMCSGYYDYENGFTPQFDGVEEFTGRVVHPQHWPEDLDPTGQRFVVIGSGATAVTLVPALAEAGAAQVTMLQRSPTYVISQPAVDRAASLARRVLPERAAYALLRAKNVRVASTLYRLCQRFPGPMRRVIRAGNVALLPDGYDVDTHFNPRYGPWDQRLCLVPDADLFSAIGRGDAEVVTDTVETFTPTGIRTGSGRDLEADVVVTATGLNLLAFGGASFTVDSEPVDLTSTMAYKALMLSGMPNFAYTIGYTNASWTLKADLVAEYVCRVLGHMAAHGHTTVVPVSDPAVTPEPFMDFEAGYVLRALDRLPKQGDREPWKLRQNYARDVRTIRHGPIDDGVLAFG